MMIAMTAHFRKRFLKKKKRESEKESPNLPVGLSVQARGFAAGNAKAVEMNRLVDWIGNLSEIRTPGNRHRTRKLRSRK
jgi:hypothetical protein